ncbi:MAG: UDP-2,3-diacylglucosamine diphosphatase [Planctomycetes bacterium]|nr:UDP-2,3-diacylglucosamine diphosphatase [Planctomycetota bacterium]
MWISDVHLGTRTCRADLLLHFLNLYSSEYLYLVGDVVDGWNLKRSWYWNDEHNRVLQSILAKSSGGTRVTYVTGNHDAFLRDYAGVMLGGIAVKEEATHTTADGRELLVLHGDRFDACIRNARWLTLLGDQAYRACRWINGGLNLARRLFGLAPWSLADHLRGRVKDALAYVERFERAAAAEAKQRGFDGVVCGHVHHAAIREIDGVLYCNDGDWVDSCTALAEDHDGKLAILRLSRVRAPEALAVGAR